MILLTLYIFTNYFNKFLHISDVLIMLYIFYGFNNALYISMILKYKNQIFKFSEVANFRP
jgi:hypothetical protein